MENPTLNQFIYDIVLIARNVASLQEMLVTIKEIGMKYGLNINEAKTKYMKMEPN